jgi:hypothetical protein
MKILFTFSILLLAANCQFFVLSLKDLDLHKTTPRDTFLRYSDKEINEFFEEMKMEKDSTLNMKAAASGSTEGSPKNSNNVI